MLATHLIGVDDLGFWSQEDSYHWGAAGRELPDTDPDTDAGRLFTVAWVASLRNLTRGKVPNMLSLVRELRYDAAAATLLSSPVAEYAGLRNATFVDEPGVPVPAGGRWTAPIPAGAGGALDVLVSFDVGARPGAGGGFGVAVRAPAATAAGAALTIKVAELTAPDASGARNATIVFMPGAPRPAQSKGYVARATVPVLSGETLDVRVLVDRPIVESFIMGGRTSYVNADTLFSMRDSSVHVFNDGAAAVAASVAAHGMSCGWSAEMPTPARDPGVVGDSQHSPP